ncbi:MAG: hypothetical protein IJS32_09655 [Kiritimatiellae bacterium]|nr:hypothetical protein [Kiritimatiellia bacterium]
MTRRFLPALLLSLALAGAAHAQVQLRWEPVHKKVALYESIPVRVTVVNESGVPLDFSPAGNAALSFGIVDELHVPVRATDRPLAVPPAVVGDEETKTIETDLLPAYHLRECRHYAVVPRLHFGASVYEGEKKDIEILSGTELLRRNYGMSGSDGRIATLLSIPRNRETHLLCRIDSADGYCLGVQDLGTSLKLFPPRMERDRDGLFHVLHQAAPRTFAHTVFRPDGTREKIRYFQGEVSGMRLARTAEGKVFVSGGIPYTEDEDAPGTFTAPGTDNDAVTDFSNEVPRRERGVGTPKSWWRGGSD